MAKDDSIYKEVHEKSSKSLEEFLENLSKLIKYLLIPIALMVSLAVLKFHNLLGPFERPFTFFVGAWVGLITILIFQTYKFKINAMD